MKCQNCNIENETDAKFCENCGNVLNVRSGKKEEQPVESNILFCPKCGEKLQMGAIFCGNCGHSFDAECESCNALNQSDAKFCSSCSQPLAWICPLCKNKNEKGALFCSSCGSDSIVVHKSKKWIYIIVAASIVFATFIGVNKYQFDKNISEAYSYADNEKFEAAYDYLDKADGIWLPFVKSKLNETKNYINSQKQEFERIAQQQRDLAEQKRQEEERNSSKSSVSSSRSSTSSSTSQNNQTKYSHFASIEFRCDANKSDEVLRVESFVPGVIVKISSGKICYVSSSAAENIRGKYKFTWTFNTVSLMEVNGLGRSKKFETVSGEFYIDGLHDTYYVDFSLYGYGSSINVTGYGSPTRY